MSLLLPKPRLRIGDKPALKGQPSSANIPNLGQVDLGGSSKIEELAKSYAERHNLPYIEVLRYAQINPEFSKQVAMEFELMNHMPDDPNVQKAYKQLASETADQFEHMLSSGIKPYFIGENDPYKASPYLSLLDLSQNNRIGIFPTRSGFGSDSDFDPQGNPLMEESGMRLDGQPLLINDMFRAIHDVFGHARHGTGFRAMGEENAYQSHANMFSPLARQAAATETRGQNSWLNYGPYGEQNRTAGIDDTVFADQKTGLLPNWAVMQGTETARGRKDDFFRSLESGAGESNQGLRGAITEDGNLKLVHWSGQPLERIEPSRYGSGLSGRTRSERNRSYEDDFQERSFYGIESSDNPYYREQGLGHVKNETEIPIEQMYDYRNDPANLRDKIPSGLNDNQRINAMETLIKDAGFSGYFMKGSERGDIGVVFDPLTVGKSHKFSIAATPTLPEGGEQERRGYSFKDFVDAAKRYHEVTGKSTKLGERKRQPMYEDETGKPLTPYEEARYESSRIADENELRDLFGPEEGNMRFTAAPITKSETGREGNMSMKALAPLIGREQAELLRKQGFELGTPQGILDALSAMQDMVNSKRSGGFKGTSVWDFI